MTNASPVFRFAPSPNGQLHLGHAYSALLNERMARRSSGRLLLRIEDIDVTRCRPDFEAAIYDDLRWLGIRWETPVRRQSQHFDEYRQVWQRLADLGRIYRCFCTRGEIAAAVERREAETGRPWPRDPDGTPLYPGTCRALTPAEIAERIAAGAACAWRIDASQIALPAAAGYLRFDETGRDDWIVVDPLRWGDVVIVRKEIPTSYHLAVVWDDALQGVSHVVRGQDLEAATDVHVLLQHWLELPTPRYCHHRLIRDEAGEKLSKSLLSQPLAELRRAGWTPRQVRDWLEVD